MRQPLPRSRILGVLVLVLIGLHVALAAVIVPRLTFHADLTVDTDLDPRIGAALAREARFPVPNPLVFLTPSDQPERLKTLVRLLEGRGLTVRSILSAPGGADPVEAASHPLLARLFLNRDRTAWVVYVPTRGDGQAEANLCQDVPDRVPGVVIGGPPWARFLMDRALARNMAWLFPASLAVIFVVFWVLVRGPRQALWLTFVSCLPALDVLFLFPLLGLSFNFTTVLAPLLILALCKKYNLWVHHHLQEQGTDWKTLFAHRGRAIAWSASISSLGFTSLWLSPLPALRLLGLLLVVGLAATLFWALVAVPALARAFPGPRKAVPLLTLETPRNRGIRAALALVLLAAIPGVFSLSSALGWRDYLDAGSAEARDLARFEALYPAWQEASLHLSWAEDAGWLVPGRWTGLGSLIDRWRIRFPAATVWSVQDAARGALADLGMDAENPRTEDLGQALELLPPDTETGKLIDGSRSELVVRFEFAPGAAGDAAAKPPFESLAEEARQALPGVNVGWAGPYYRQILGMDAFLTGELWGTATFFLLVGVLIVVRLRSFRKGLLALVPSVTSAAVFLGVAGWFHWPISPATALVIAACIGQSTDDGLLWSLLPLTPGIRAFFVESTLLLCSALAVLAFSTFANINQAALLVILSLVFSTSVVLWVLPWPHRDVHTPERL
jgi:hypothetical protein